MHGHILDRTLTSLNVTCADPGGPTFFTFFYLISYKGDRGSKYHYKRAITGPPANANKNGVSLSDRWWPNTELNLLSLSGSEQQIFVFLIFLSEGSNESARERRLERSLTAIKQAVSIGQKCALKRLSKHSHFRAAKVQTSMRKGADLQEPSPHETDRYGTPRLPYNVYILFVMYKGQFGMYKFNSLCAKCISL